jgi:hypothetical protein
MGLRKPVSQRWKMHRQVGDLQLAYPVERSESLLLEAGEVVVVKAQDFEAAQR